MKKAGSGFEIISVYVAIICILAFGVKTKYDYLVLMSSVLVFLSWNLYVLFSDNFFRGRDPQDTLTSIGRARQFAAYFFPFYGIIIGAILVFSDGKAALFEIIRKS